MIPGMVPRRRRGAALELVGLTMIYPGNGPNGHIDLTGLPIRSGDLGVYWDWTRVAAGLGPPPTMTPSGHTKRVETSVGAARGIISTKILNGTETVIVGMAGPEGSTTRSYKIYGVFRPRSAIISISAHSVAGQMTNGDPSPQTISSGSTAGYPILVLGQMACFNQEVNPRSVSPPMQEIRNTPGSGHQYAHWKLYEGAAVDHTYDMNAQTNENTLQSCYLRITL